MIRKYIPRVLNHAPSLIRQRVPQPIHPRVFTAAAHPRMRIERQVCEPVIRGIPCRGKNDLIEVLSRFAGEFSSVWEDALPWARGIVKKIRRRGFKSLRLSTQLPAGEGDFSILHLAIEPLRRNKRFFVASFKISSADGKVDFQWETQIAYHMGKTRCLFGIHWQASLLASLGSFVLDLNKIGNALEKTGFDESLFPKDEIAQCFQTPRESRRSHIVPVFIKDAPQFQFVFVAPHDPKKKQYNLAWQPSATNPFHLLTPYYRNGVRRLIFQIILRNQDSQKAPTNRPVPWTEKADIEAMIYLGHEVKQSLLSGL